jgi:hypothetical protein
MRSRDNFARDSSAFWMHPVSWRRAESFYWLDGTSNSDYACLLDVNEVVKSCKAEVKLCKLSGIEGVSLHGRRLEESTIMPAF